MCHYHHANYLSCSPKQLDSAYNINELQLHTIVHSVWASMIYAQVALLPRVIVVVIIIIYNYYY